MPLEAQCRAGTVKLPGELRNHIWELAIPSNTEIDTTSILSAEEYALKRHKICLDFTIGTASSFVSPHVSERVPWSAFPESSWWFESQVHSTDWPTDATMTQDLNGRIFVSVPAAALDQRLEEVKHLHDFGFRGRRRRGGG